MSCRIASARARCETGDSDADVELAQAIATLQSELEGCDPPEIGDPPWCGDIANWPADAQREFIMAAVQSIPRAIIGVRATHEAYGDAALAAVRKRPG